MLKKRFEKQMERTLGSRMYCPMMHFAQFSFGKTLKGQDQERVVGLTYYRRSSILCAFSWIKWLNGAKEIRDGL